MVYMAHDYDNGGSLGEIGVLGFSRYLFCCFLSFEYSDGFFIFASEEFDDVLFKALVCG